MKELKYLIINLIITTFVYGQSLSLKIELEKQNYLIGEPIYLIGEPIYLIGEPIYLIAELINNDSRPIYHLPFNFYDKTSGLEMIVLDSWGKEIECRFCSRADVIGPPYIKLLHGESAINYNNILLDYGELKQGKYFVRLKYRYFYYDERSKIKTEKYFFSEQKEFSINEPLDSIDISAYSELKSIEKIYHQITAEEKINYLIDFTNKYSNSIYVIDAYRLLISEFSLKKDKRYEYYNEILFSKFPNSFSSYCLASLMNRLLSDPVYQSKVTDKRIIETLMKIESYNKKVSEAYKNKSK